MPARDTTKSFGAVSIALHWINAGFVLALLVIGVYSFILPNSHGVGLRHQMLDLHSSIGLIALPFILARVVWRIRHGKPEAPKQHKAFKRIADIVWPLLLLGMTLQILTGPLLYGTHHLPLKIFGVTVVRPFLPFMARPYNVLQTAHEWVGFTLVALVSLHILGALKHAIIDRDGVVTRIVWPRGSETAGSHGSPLHARAAE